MSAKMELKGISVFIQQISSASKLLKKSASQALYLEGQLLMTEAKKRTPVAEHDGGTLQASGTVSKPEISEHKITVQLGFGGAASEYAIAVHEHLSVHSPPSWKIAEAHGNGVQWHRPGSGPKFLENPMNEVAPEMEARLARRINAALGTK